MHAPEGYTLFHLLSDPVRADHRRINHSATEFLHELESKTSLKFKVVCRDETIGGKAFNHVMPIGHGDLNYLAFDDLSPPLPFSDTPTDDEGGAAIWNVFRDQANLAIARGFKSIIAKKGPYKFPDNSPVVSEYQVNRGATCRVGSLL
jgi:hypothetical protein